MNDEDSVLDWSLRAAISGGMKLFGVVVHRPHDESAPLRWDWIGQAWKDENFLCSTLTVKQSGCAVTLVVSGAQQLEVETSRVIPSGRNNAQAPKA